MGDLLPVRQDETYVKDVLRTLDQPRGLQLVLNKLFLFHERAAVVNARWNKKQLASDKFVRRVLSLLPLSGDEDVQVASQHTAHNTL